MDGRRGLNGRLGRADVSSTQGPTRRQGGRKFGRMQQGASCSWLASTSSIYVVMGRKRFADL